MRNSIISKLIELAQDDEKVYLLSGDLGYGVLNDFSNTFPDRFINVGIAEQNMAAIAAGLALSGNIVFVYSIGNFPSLRCLEQIRNDICYHNANVIILSLGAGFAYGKLGFTHHATEDISIMRSLPNMKVYSPADSNEAVACLKDAYDKLGPSYFRLAKGGESMLTENTIIKIPCLSEIFSLGKDFNILTTGTVLSEGVKLRNILLDYGLDVGLYSVPSIKPISRDEILNIAKSCSTLLTIEDHTINGGLGSCVAEIISEIRSPKAILYRFGLQDTFSSIVGDELFIRQFYGIDAQSIFERLQEIGGL